MMPITKSITIRSISRKGGPKPNVLAVVMLFYGHKTVSTKAVRDLMMPLEREDRDA